MNQKRKQSKILFFYISKMFLTSLFCCLGGFITLFIIIQLFDIMPDFLRRPSGFLLLLEYLAYSLPQQLLFAVLPISVLLSASFMIISMTMNHEITALRSAGVSLFYCFTPVWLITLVLSMISLTLSYYPLASQWTREAKRIIDFVEDDSTVGFSRNSIIEKKTFFSRDGSRQWVFGAWRKEGFKDKMLVRQYFKNEDNTKIEWELNAQTTNYSKKDNAWHFYDSNLVVFDLEEKNLSKEDLERRNNYSLGNNPKYILINSSKGRKIIFASKIELLEEEWICSNCFVEEFDMDKKFVKVTPQDVFKIKFENIAVKEENLLLKLEELKIPEQNYTNVYFDKVESVNLQRKEIVLKNVVKVKYVDGELHNVSFDEVLVKSMDCTLQYFKLNPEKQDDYTFATFIWAPMISYRRAGEKTKWIYEKGIRFDHKIETQEFKLENGELPLFLLRSAGENERIFDEVPSRAESSTATKDELCIEELRNLIRRTDTLPEEIKHEYWVAIWNRVFSSFMPLIAALIGISLSLIKERTNPVSGFVKATCFMLSFYAVDQLVVLSGSIHAITIPAMVIGGITTVVYLTLGILLMWRRQ